MNYGIQLLLIAYPTTLSFAAKHEATFPHPPTHTNTSNPIQFKKSPS